MIADLSELTTTDTFTESVQGGPSPSPSPCLMYTIHDLRLGHGCLLLGERQQSFVLLGFPGLPTVHSDSD